MTPLDPINLQCAHQAAPQGLNNTAPTFSWALSGEGNDRYQTAYRIVVADQQDLTEPSCRIFWDSGITRSDYTRFVTYEGETLSSNQTLFWRVKVWDENKRESRYSPPARIHTGLMDAKDWHANWIARYFVLPAGREAPADNLYDNQWQARPADYMRRNLNIGRKIDRATAYITALGLYEFSINGQKVGDEIMAPGWTDYHQHVDYQTHDVTNHLDDGDNAIGVILGEGWYSGRVGHNQRRAGNHYGGRPALLFQLHIEYEDGTSERIFSDNHWKTTQGPVCYSDFLIGELYDARLEMSGWDCPDFDDNDWQPVEIFTPEPREPRLDASTCQPVREVAEFPAKFIHKSSAGAHIYDIGQNLAGYVRLSLTASHGTKFSLRHAEILDESGELYTKNLRHAVSTDHYIAKGEGLEIYKPRFTFHGFRYVELSTSDNSDLDDAELELVGIAIQSDTPLTGTLTSGHALINQLSANITWSQRGNFLSVPTDCPQRDERLGWSADAQIFWRTAGYNMDVAAFLSKWFKDIIEAQLPDGAFTDIAPARPLNPYRQSAQPGAPGWGDAPIILAWQHYLRYGDQNLMRQHYPALRLWMDHILAQNPDHLRRASVYNNYGDWLSVGPVSDRTLVATAYWAHIADLMGRIASVLEETSDNAEFELLAQSIRDAFVDEFVDTRGKIFGDTQTAYLLALDFDILPENLRRLAGNHLINSIKNAKNHLQTGFLGVKHLCPVLADIGASDLAYTLLLNTTYPSWGFSITQGATTIWERWDGWTKEKGFQSANMNSFNHYAYGAVGEWMWARMAGIDWDENDPGFKTIQFRPLFNQDIGWVKAHYLAPTGKISSAWAYDDKKIEWTITIPPNCRGHITLPAPSRRCKLDGTSLPVAANKFTNADSQTQCALGSGTYTFTISAI